MSVIARLRPLSSKTLRIISRGEWLTDDHVEYFHQLLQAFSQNNYKPQGTWKIHFLDQIVPISENESHIQILHSCDNFETNARGHWVCSYYNCDRKKIYIYDSLNSKTLHENHVSFLQNLYPFIITGKNSIDERYIEYPLVQYQPNTDDCGVFAIAFAVSLLFRIPPDKVIYNHAVMREHLLNMFNTNCIKHFPTIGRPITQQIIFSPEQTQRHLGISHGTESKGLKTMGNQKQGVDNSKLQQIHEKSKQKKQSINNNSKQLLEKFKSTKNCPTVSKIINDSRTDYINIDSSCSQNNSQNNCVENNVMNNKKQEKKHHEDSTRYIDKKSTCDNAVANTSQKNDDQCTPSQNFIIDKSHEIISGESVIHSDKEVECTNKVGIDKSSISNSEITDSFTSHSKNSKMRKSNKNYYEAHKEEINRKRKAKYQKTKDGGKMKRRKNTNKVNTVDLLEEGIFRPQAANVLLEIKNNSTFNSTEILNKGEALCNANQAGILQRPKNDLIIKKPDEIFLGQSPTYSDKKVEYENKEDTDLLSVSNSGIIDLSASHSNSKSQKYNKNYYQAHKEDINRKRKRKYREKKDGVEKKRRKNSNQVITVDLPKEGVLRPRAAIALANMKNYYKVNRKEILKNRKKYYHSNKVGILQRRKKRFKKKKNYYAQKVQGLLWCK